MAYDKHTWTCDEPITVERLNHIEDGIANAGGGDCGFECEEEIVTLTEETVTTTAQGGYNAGNLSYSQFIDAETIRVTFNGVEYDCPRMGDNNESYYGGTNPTTLMPDFSVYPFAISSYNSGSDVGGRGNTRDIDPAPNLLATETAGTYSVKIEALKTNATITSCFEAAVKEANTSMGSIVVPMEASLAIVKCSTGMTGSPYAIPANSSATVRFTFSEQLSERAALRQIIVPTGILLGKIQPFFQSAYVNLSVYNITADSITLTNDNASMEFVDFEEPETVCVMMSNNCSSPGPSPK